MGDINIFLLWLAHLAYSFSLESRETSDDTRPLIVGYLEPVTRDTSCAQDFLQIPGDLFASLTIVRRPKCSPRNHEPPRESVHARSRSIKRTDYTLFATRNCRVCDRENEEDFHVPTENAHGGNVPWSVWSKLRTLIFTMPVAEVCYSKVDSRSLFKRPHYAL